MRKVNLTIVICIAMILGILALAVRLNGVPVVFKDPVGNLCGCAGPKDKIPTLEACKAIEPDAYYEVIYVSNCKGGK